MLTVPVPASILVPLAIEIRAAPASRALSTTPLAAVSLAVSVNLPLSVLMFPLSNIERPACRVSAPPVPLALLVTRLVDSVMSLLACSVSAVPAFKKLRISAAKSVLLAAGFVLNASVVLLSAVLGPLMIATCPALVNAWLASEGFGWA